MGFYLRLKKFFIADMLAIKFFFISALTLLQIVLHFSSNLSPSMKKYIHLVCPSKLFKEALVLGIII